MNINLILGVIAIVWSLFLTSFIVWFYLSLKNILKDSKDKNFLKTFKNIEEIQQKNLKDILNLNLDLDSFKKESRLNIQRVGLTKYNPFKEIGGNNSFSLVLLDGNKNGIIITSLHTRERTRLYLKEVISGKPKIELSDDEEKALKESLK
jgi:hypothetical protein